MWTFCSLNVKRWLTDCLPPLAQWRFENVCNVDNTILKKQLKDAFWFCATKNQRSLSKRKVESEQVWVEKWNRVVFGAEGFMGRVWSYSKWTLIIMWKASLTVERRKAFSDCEQRLRHSPRFYNPQLCMLPLTFRWTTPRKATINLKDGRRRRRYAVFLHERRIGWALIQKPLHLNFASETHLNSELVLSSKKSLCFPDMPFII